MRLGGPPKRRRDGAPNRIPPMWTPARNPGVPPPMWRFPPLRAPFYVPAPFLTGGADGAPAPSTSQDGAAAARKDKARIVQFEWNGCTFYRYIPDGKTGGGGRLLPGEPPFGRPRDYDWPPPRGPRSQSRRHRQGVPPRAAAPPAPPPWSTPGLPERKLYGAAPFRPRENPRIPRKDPKAPASHLHLPPFMTGAASAKPTASGSSTKSQSPASTTSNPLGPPPRSAILHSTPKNAALPFSARPYRTPDDRPLSAQPKMKSPAMTIRRSQEIPESDRLGAKPKRPLRTTTSKPERPSSSTYSSASIANKTFARPPPFRNNPRVYSSTVLKDFNVTGRHGHAEKLSWDKGHQVMATPQHNSPPKEQRRQEKRVRYKAEIVGSNIIVTSQETSPDKKQEGAFDCSRAFAIGPQGSKAKEGEPASGISGVKNPPVPTPGEKTAGLNEAFKAGIEKGRKAANLNPTKADAFTQMSDGFATNAGDKLVYPRPTTLTRDDVSSPADSEEDGKFRNVSVQTPTTDTPSETQLFCPGTEYDVSGSDDKDDDPNEKSHRLADEEQNCISEDPPTSSSEIYLDSLISTGTPSSSSPKEDVQRKLKSDGIDEMTDRTALLMEDLGIFLKDCSPIKCTDERSSCESKSPCLEPTGNDDSGSSRDDFLGVPRLVKDVGDTISTASDVILINFAEDTTTLKEHLDGIVADYKARVRRDNEASVGDDHNVLESHAGTSPAESGVPVLKPSAVSLVRHDAALEKMAAGDYNEDAPCGSPPPMKTQQAEVFESGDQKSACYSGYPGADGPGVHCTSDNSKSYCNRCGVYSPSCDSAESEGVVRVCSCKTRLARKRDVCKVVYLGDLALKEEYRDPEIVPCFAEESVEYLLLESEEEDYEEEERQVAAEQQGEERKMYISGWSKRDVSDYKPGQDEAGASRRLIYDCPWWINDHDEDVVRKKPVEEDSGSVAFARDLAQADLNPWSLQIAEHRESSPDRGGPSGEETNPWTPSYAGPRPKVVLSSGDQRGSAEARPTRSDADFSTLYMEGQPRKPCLKQFWAPHYVTAEDRRVHGLDRDSLSFYEFSMNEQQGTHAHSLSMETLVGSSRQEAEPTSTAGEGSLAEGEPMPGLVDEKATGSPSHGQYCELELYATVNKSGLAACNPVMPTLPDVDGSKGDALEEGGPRAPTPPDDIVDSSGDKKATENKPMGKIRTRFRDFFWKHK